MMARPTQAIAYNEKQGFYVQDVSRIQYTSSSLEVDVLPVAAQKLRAALGCDLTEEQVECARLEAQLEQAVADRIIVRHRTEQVGTGWDTWVWKGSNACLPHGIKPTKLAALRAAVAHLATLRKPKLEAEKRMSVAACVAELHGRGCELGYWSDEPWRPQWMRDGENIHIADSYESTQDFHRTALYNARKLDGDA